MLLTSAPSASSAVNLNYKNYWLIECKLKQIMFPGSLAKGIPDHSMSLSRRPRNNTTSKRQAGEARSCCK